MNLEGLNESSLVQFAKNNDVVLSKMIAQEGLLILCRHPLEQLQTLGVIHKMALSMSDEECADKFPQFLDLFEAYWNLLESWAAQ